MYPTSFGFHAPGNLVFGAGAIRQLGERVHALGGRRALVVTDAMLVRAGVVEPALASLRAAGVEPVVFDGVEENPSSGTCEQGAAAYREEGCDCVVGFGGGSPMDAAKVVAVLATHGGRPTDYEGMNRLRTDPAPLIAVPTTAGTGSEVTFNAVITDLERKFKFVIISPKVAPLAAVLDPELTLSKPPGLTAATGMDVLTHAVESYTNNVYNPFSRIMAAEAIRLVGTSLRNAVTNGRDLEGRAHMLLASVLAAYAFNLNRLGVVHAMSHPLSAHCGVPHGVANAILLTRVMAYNLPACEERTAEIAVLLGERVEGLSRLDAAHRAVGAVRRLARDVGIPATLQDVGVDPAVIPAVAADAMKSALVGINPRRTTLQDVTGLYAESFQPLPG